jgi:hypothetical protein
MLLRVKGEIEKRFRAEADAATQQEICWRSWRSWRPFCPDRDHLQAIQPRWRIAYSHIASDASFCSPNACSSAAPDRQEHYINWKETAVGSKTWTVHLQTEDAVVHTVSIKGEVKSFRGCNCSLMGDRNSAAGAVTWALCSLAMLVGRRGSRALRS